jgi:hypothetical protein
MCRQDQHRDAAGRGVNRAHAILQIATPLVWLGMVLGISVLETPLKFRAPGITRALGLGIGRLVFRTSIPVSNPDDATRTRKGEPR